MLIWSDNIKLPQNLYDEIVNKIEKNYIVSVCISVILLMIVPSCKIPIIIHCNITKNISGLEFSRTPR